MRLVHYKSFFATSVALTGMAITLTGAAVAADLPVSSLPVIEHVEQVQLSNWYLRGDVGASISQQPDFSVNIPNSATPTDFSDVSTEAAATFGIGLGYQFSNGIRVDVTGDYIAPQEYSARPWNYGQATGSFTNGVDPFYTGKAKMKRESAVAMVNAYYEFSNFGNFRPYLGAGIGVAWNRIDDATYYDEYLYQNVLNSGYSFPNQNIPGQFTQESKDSTNLAWALMAGVAYQLTDRIDLDIGYKYLNLGDCRTGGVLYTDNSALATGQIQQTDNYSRIENVADHQIRIGMRYKFGG